MLANKIIRVESAFLAILIMTIFNESVLFDFLNKSLVNFLVLFAVIIIYFQSKLTRNAYILLPLLFVLLFSVAVNANKISVGGFNTFIAFITSLPFLFLKRKTVDVVYIYKGLVFISVLFLILVYYYYYFGIQEIPEHLFYILAGPYTNQNILAMFLFSFIALLVFFYPKPNDRLSKNKLLGVLVFLFYISILLTQSRSAILSSTIILLYYYRKYLFFVVPTFIGFLFIFSASLFSESFSERAGTKFLNSNSSGRVDFWYNTLSGLTNNIMAFLFGSGVNNTRVEVDDGTISVHSSYVNFIANYGFLAALFMFLILIYIVCKSYKSSRLLFVIISSILIYGVFETVLFAGYTILWLTMLFIYYSHTGIRGHNAHFNRSFITSSY